MSDLISREDALQAKPEFLNPVCGINEGWNKAISEYWENIKALPSAKAVHKPDYSYEADMVRRLKGAQSAETVQGYSEWLEKIIVMLEPVDLCEDTTDKEWCEENCGHASIQAECLRQWIPCSERLPLVADQEVLATTIWGDVTIANRCTCDDWFIHEGNSNAKTRDIIAWMPLPKPYREESEVEE